MSRATDSPSPVTPADATPEAPPAPAPVPMPTAPASPLDRPYRLSIVRYERMGKAGILGAEERVYLWKGRVVQRMTKSRPHTIAVLRVYNALRDLGPQGWYAEDEQPLGLGNESMPEPDATLIRGRMEDDPDSPRASDAGLFVEVADTTLAQNRGDKLMSYAAESVPVYWIVNLTDRRVEVYAEPTGPAEAPTYRSRGDYAEGESVPVVLDGREVGRLAVAEILPPTR